ncbi:MAG: hypothetical protein Q6363_007765 [Candidatus Njordarchaeota archaeon]
MNRGIEVSFVGSPHKENHAEAERVRKFLAERISDIYTILDILAAIEYNNYAENLLNGVEVSFVFQENILNDAPFFLEIVEPKYKYIHIEEVGDVPYNMAFSILLAQKVDTGDIKIVLWPYAGITDEKSAKYILESVNEGDTVIFKLYAASVRFRMATEVLEEMIRCLRHKRANVIVTYSGTTKPLYLAGSTLFELVNIEKRNGKYESIGILYSSAGYPLGWVVLDFQKLKKGPFEEYMALKKEMIDKIVKHSIKYFRGEA